MYKLCIILFSVGYFGCIAQPVNFKKLDDVITKYEKRNKMMGSVSFSENGKTTYTGTFGFADLDTKTKANDSTKYRIGSISKTFTACMILQLVAEQHITLDETIDRFFPTWPNAKNITVKHLLQHRSGLYNFGKSTDLKYKNVNPQNSSEIIAVLQGAPVAFAAGEKFDYNNANYVALSLIIEALDERSFKESLHARIIEPLALQNTFAGGKIDIGQNQANSYYWTKKWVKNGDHYNPTLMGAGALVSTPNNVNTFMHALFSHSILPKSQLEEMKTLTDNIGLGLNAFPFYNNISYGHAGNLASFESFTAYFPEKNVAFTLCLNGNRLDFNQLLIELLRAYFTM